MNVWDQCVNIPLLLCTEDCGLECTRCCLFSHDCAWTLLMVLHLHANMLHRGKRWITNKVIHYVRWGLKGKQNTVRLKLEELLSVPFSKHGNDFFPILVSFIYRCCVLNCEKARAVYLLGSRWLSRSTSSKQTKQGQKKTIAAVLFSQTVQLNAGPHCSVWLRCLDVVFTF